MSRRFRALFRLTAVILLLLTGAEIFACEMITPDRCESFGFPSDNQTPTGGDDNCICCCTHILVAQPVTLDACAEAVAIIEESAPAPPASEPLSIYRPPKV